MSHRREQIELTQRLADAQFDGTIAASEARQLEQLISEDFTCLQAYVERIDFHGELVEQTDHLTNLEAAVGVLQDIEEWDNLRPGRVGILIWPTVLATLAFILMVGGGLFLHLGRGAVPLGSIAHLTSNARLATGKTELGRIVRSGEVLSITEGVLSIQLPHVLIDLIGPARVRLNDSLRVDLLSGALCARVQPDGSGFTVRTTDAEVIDLGTEFFVNYDRVTGTEVSVRHGRARAALLDGAGIPSRILDLTSHRSATLHQGSQISEETHYRPEQFSTVDQTRGLIRSMDGAMKTAASPPASLLPEQTSTPNHILLIPERQGMILERELDIRTLTGLQRLPAGTTVSSYLVHYDPTRLAATAPRGSITFFGTIAAVITDTETLIATDVVFGLPETIYEKQPFRGLERDADEIRISEDGRTISLFFGMAPPAYQDQARILVIAD